MEVRVSLGTASSVKRGNHGGTVDARGERRRRRERAHLRHRRAFPMKREAETRERAAEAVGKVLGEQRNRAESDAAAGRAGRRGRQPATAISEEVLARLVGEATGQRESLLSRLASNDPTRKARASPTRRQPQLPEQTTALTKPCSETEVSLGSHRKRRVRGLGHPMTADEFCQKYAADDPMLQYLLKVIAEGKSVTRAEIPRRPEGVDAKRRQLLPEEDVLFLTYHRNPPCGFRNVYWLEMISEDRAIDIEVEYFTLSHHGLTHFRGSSVIDFVDIDSWVSEKRAFDYMTAMRGLQKLQGLLFFMSWKKKAIRLKHQRVRDRLACSLFHCDLAASRLMISIRESCVEIEQYVETNQSPSCISRSIERILEHSRDRVRATRLDVLRQVDRICERIAQAIVELQHQRDFELEAEKQNYANVSRSSRLLDRLYVFLRLADFQVFESICMHLKDFIITLHDQVCGAEATESQPSTEAKEGFASNPVSSNLVSKTLLLENASEDTQVRVSYSTQFSLRQRRVPFPFLYGQLLEDLRFGTDVANTEMKVKPPQRAVFDLIHTWLNGYILCLDGIPRILADRRFRSVLGPHTPQNRDTFLASLFRPSTQILQYHQEQLKGMRHAIETYYKQLEIQLTDRLRLLKKIYYFEQSEDLMKESNEVSHEYKCRILTATQYENSLAAWESVLHEVTTTPRLIQVGIFLLDQSSLLDRLQSHVASHIHDMQCDLPSVYIRFLSDLLSDVDGRLEKIMNIPTSIPDGVNWLKAMTEMMPTQSFRIAFDTKCENLARLKQLLKSEDIYSLSLGERDAVKKKDLEWESLHETLLTCFTRVQEKDSEHRRSIVELSAKADEYILVQLQQVKADFSKLPQHQEEISLSKHKAKELAKTKQDLIERLERLVALDGEREEMLECFSSFEYQHRLVSDPGSTESNLPQQAFRQWETKPPSGLLLQHVSIVIDMRSWFCSWHALEEKWFDTPLTSMHPNMVLSRLKQFRRRLQFASTRLIPIAKAESEDEFVSRDHSLVDDIKFRVDRMASNFIVLQAATSGSFSPDKWTLSRPLLGSEHATLSQVTLRYLSDKSLEAPESFAKFKQLCENIVIEAKLKGAAEILRQRLRNCRLAVRNSCSHVAFENLQDAVFELDDIEVETVLLSQTINPNLDLVISLLNDVRSGLLLCESLLGFQALWGNLCKLTQVHDIDEFFTGQVAWKGPVQRQRKKIGRDESVWNEFIQITQDWIDRLRRLICISQSSLSPTVAPIDFNATTVMCPLSDVEEAYQGFDFKIGSARCELAHQLLDKYLGDLREKCPRLYLLDKPRLIRLLTNDIDSRIIRETLAVCYPLVQSFNIGRSRREEESVSLETGLNNSRTGDAQGTLMIKGFATKLAFYEFKVPIVKVGRLRFWLTRLEEELGNAILEDVKLAITKIFPLLESQAEAFQASLYLSHLTQSILVALTMGLTSAVESVFQSASNQSSLLTQLKDSYIRALEGFTKLARVSDANWCDSRLETIVLLLSYQIEVLDELGASVSKGGKDGAELLWQFQLRVDFMIEDTSAKTFRRVRCCDASEWRSLVTLGPSFPITFFANIGRGNIALGRELASARRVPLVTPITQRCIYEIAQAIRGLSCPLLGAINSRGDGGQSSVIRGIAQLLMKPLHEFTCSPSVYADLEVLSGLLSAVTSMGSIIVVHRFETLNINPARMLLETINQRMNERFQGVVHAPNSSIEHRGGMTLTPMGCVVISMNKSYTSTMEHILVGSTMNPYRPVTVTLPSLSYFTKAMALLAGYQSTEIDAVRPLITFVESLSQMASDLEQNSTMILRLVANAMKEVSQLRFTHRVLLPSNTKWSHQFPGAGRRTGARRMSNLFRRSADAQDTSDVVMQTLFNYVFSVRYRGYIARAFNSISDSLPDEVSQLLGTCFPSAHGCDLVEKSSGAAEEALWEALKISFENNSLVANIAQLEKALELFKALESSPAVVVVGTVNSGKSTCIRILHRAVEALELANLVNDNGDEIPAVKLSKLVFTSSQYIGLRGLSSTSAERIISKTFGELYEDASRMTHRWLCIDGDLDLSDSEHTLIKFPQTPINKTSHSVNYHRLIFEAASLESLSPAFITRTRLVHVPSTVGQGDVIASWHGFWMKKFGYPDDSRGAENLQKVLKLTEQLISGPVKQFVLAEETSASFDSTQNRYEPRHQTTHLGMLSLLHLTQTTLQLVSTACLSCRSLIEDASSGHLARLVAFCVIWGFTGHLSESYRTKLEQQIVPVLKQVTDVKKLGDLQCRLFDSEQISEGFWDAKQLPLRGVHPSILSRKEHQNSTMLRSVTDISTGRILVLPSAAIAIVRIMRLLLRFEKSFLLVGPRGSGKSSILRLLWALNLEDVAAESMIDASFDHRKAPDILNWQDKPRTWFHCPLSTPCEGSQARPKVADEAQLFEALSAGAAKFIFVDDVGAHLDRPGEVELMDEFVRISLDHHTAINWTSERILPLFKAFGATMATHQAAAPRLRVSNQTERLLRHFSVLRVPTYDRQQIQGIFQQVLTAYFAYSDGTYSSKPGAFSASFHGNERVLTPCQVILRASVDLAVDLLTIQQTSDTLSIIKGFTFNFHHLSELLKRSLSFSNHLAKVHRARNIQDGGGATLLALGKLHQCWASTVRQIFLTPIVHHMRQSGREASAEVVVDDVKKVEQSVRLIGEKYFSVPAREEFHANLVTDIVYGTYRAVMNSTTASEKFHAKASELLTANASTTSSARGRRNGVSEGEGPMLARDEFVVRVSRELILERVKSFLFDSSEKSTTVAELRLRLQLGSSVGLHELLHLLQAIQFSSNILIDHELSPIQRELTHLAFIVQGYDVIEYDTRSGVSRSSFRELLENTLLAVVSQRAKLAIWVDIDRIDDLKDLRDATEAIYAACMGKAQPILFDSRRLRDEVVKRYTHDQGQLEILSSDNVIASFSSILHEQFRLCIVTTGANSDMESLIESVRMSAAFQWVSLVKAQQDFLRYRGEVVRHAIDDICGVGYVQDSQADQIDGTLSWGSLYGECESFLGQNVIEDTEERFLTFTVNVVASYKNRRSEFDARIADRELVVKTLEWICERVPQLQGRSTLLRNRIQQLASWHDELLEPLDALRNELRMRSRFLHEQEAELSNDEVRTLSRKLEKIVLQIWAHRSMICEYDLARVESTQRRNDVEAELCHWSKYEETRGVVARNYSEELESLLNTRQDPIRMVKQSINQLSFIEKPSNEDAHKVDRECIDEIQRAWELPDQIVYQLWQARFPFLKFSEQTAMILPTIDSLHDRIPLVVDRSGIFQCVLVHILSNLPWFSDGNEERDHRESIGSTASGAVAPVIVQCDGSPKMWRRLNEAAQKQVPTLLVGVSSKLLKPLSHFAQRNVTTSRSRFLRELTLDSYRSQLKRDVQQAKASSSTGNISISVPSGGLANSKKNRRPGVAPGDMKWLTSALSDAAKIHTDACSDPINGSQLRGDSFSLTVNTLIPHVLGFQLYAVTQYEIDESLARQGGQFVPINAQWSPLSIESFFNDAFLRRYDKKLHKHLLDTRRIIPDSSYTLSQCERELSVIVRSPSCLSPIGRDRFMKHVQRLNDEYVTDEAHRSQVPSRLATLLARQRSLHGVGRGLALIAQSASCFAQRVYSGLNGSTSSYRYFEQLLDVTVGAMMKHAEDIRFTPEQEGGSKLPQISRYITTTVLQSVLAGLRSSAHQRAMLMILGTMKHPTSSNQANCSRVGITDDGLEKGVAWIFSEGLPRWRESVQKVVDGTNWRPIGNSENGEQEDGIHTETIAVSSISSAISPSTGLSLVERLRRKVRICSLIFDRVGHRESSDDSRRNIRRSTTEGHAHNAGKKEDLYRYNRRTSSQDSVGTSLRDDLRRDFRVLACVTKTMWCEWKLSKEDHRGELQRTVSELTGVYAVFSNNPRKLQRPIKDMVLGSSNVTLILSLDDVFTNYLDQEAGSSSATKSIKERLAVVVIAKSCFLHLFQAEWISFLHEFLSTDIDDASLHKSMSTSQLLKLDPLAREGRRDDVPTPIAPIQMASLLPPSIDTAWRRDDLVHLPTSLLVYDAPTERTTVEVLLLRATSPTQSNPLRVIPVISLDECEFRLEEQLTAATTNKERFAIEIFEPTTFDRIVALASQVINQHALLCIPEWYVICTLEIADQLQSPFLGFLHVHVVSKEAESADLVTQLTELLVCSTGLGEQDARMAARSLVCQADDIHPKPLRREVELLGSQVKAIALSGDNAANQQLMKREVVSKLQGELRAPPNHSQCVARTQSSLRFLSELLLLPSPNEKKVSTESATVDDRGVLPPSCEEILEQVDCICVKLLQVLSDDTSREQASSTVSFLDASHNWRSWFTMDARHTITTARSVVERIRYLSAQPASRATPQQLALVRHGLFPAEWFAECFSLLSDACLANAVSIAQVFVLIVARVGYLVDEFSGGRIQTLHASLLHDFSSALVCLREAFVSRQGVDPCDVIFVLDVIDAKVKAEPADAPKISRERRNSQVLPRGLDQGGLQRALPMGEAGSYLLTTDEGHVCGIHVSGLVAVEKCVTKSGLSIMIHELPPCRLVCQTRPTIAPSDEPGRLNSSRATSADNTIATILRYQGTRLTTIVSTSAFQNIPEEFWAASREEPSAGIWDVTCSASLFASVPSLSRQRGDLEMAVAIVFAIPVFPNDDDDHD